MPTTTENCRVELMRGLHFVQDMGIPVEELAQASAVAPERARVMIRRSAQSVVRHAGTLLPFHTNWKVLWWMA